MVDFEMEHRVKTIIASCAQLGLLLWGLSAQSAFADFASSAEAARPLAIGDKAPDFTASRVDRTTLAFSPEHLHRPAVLIFYRGGWCPYCNTQMSDMHAVEPRLRAAGFDVLFVSTDRPELLYSSLKDQTINYTLLSDPQLKAAQAFHIAYHLSDELYAQQLKYGVDLEKTTGTKAHALPVPSVFIVDQKGAIRFVYSNPDFRVRLKADELWKVAQPLAPTAPSDQNAN
jgi:peroxiredoxin